MGDDQYKIIDETNYGVSNNCNWGWNNTEIQRKEYIEDRTELDDCCDAMENEYPLMNGLVDDVDASIENLRSALESAGIRDVLAELESQAAAFVAEKQEN